MKNKFLVFALLFVLSGCNEVAYESNKKLLMGLDEANGVIIDNTSEPSNPLINFNTSVDSLITNLNKSLDFYEGIKSAIRLYITLATILKRSNQDPDSILQSINDSLTTIQREEIQDQTIPDKFKPALDALNADKNLFIEALQNIKEIISNSQIDPSNQT